MTYQYLVIEKSDKGYARVQFNRLRQLHALCAGMFDELCGVLTDFDSDVEVRPWC